MVRSATVIRGGDGATAGTAGSEMEDIQDHGEDAVNDDDEDDRGDHGGGGGETDGGGASPRLHAAEAPHEGNEDAEHYALADPDEEAGQTHGVAGLLIVLGGAYSEHAHADDRAAEDPDEVGIDGKERHHQDQRQHPGKDEEFHRRDPHGGERVDLLIGRHRPELRGKGG